MICWRVPSFHPLNLHSLYIFEPSDGFIWIDNMARVSKYKDHSWSVNMHNNATCWALAFMPLPHDYSSNFLAWIMPGVQQSGYQAQWGKRQNNRAMKGADTVYLIQTSILRWLCYCISFTPTQHRCINPIVLWVRVDVNNKRASCPARA